MDFSSASSGSSSSSSKINPEAFKDQVRNQFALAFMEEFIETLNSKRFDKCITKPGSSMSGSESSCISRCVDRYAEASALIAGAMLNQH